MTTMYPPDVRIVPVPPDPRDLRQGECLACGPGNDSACGNCGSDEGVLYLYRMESWGDHHQPMHWVNGVKLPMSLLGVSCPVCRGGQRQAWLLETSGLDGIALNGKPASGFRVADLHLRGQGSAREACSRLLRAPGTSALFYGDKGTGKTRILMTLVNEHRLAGRLARYILAERLLGQLRDTYNKESNQETEQVRSQFARVAALAVDEIDRVNWTDWASEQLFSILNERDLAGRTTYLASNLAPQKWAGVSDVLDAVRSRISAGEMILVEGQDLRPMLQKEFLE